MSAPARMKSGSASSTNESTWWRIVCTVTASGHRGGEQRAHVAGEAHRDRHRHPDREQDQEDEADEDHRPHGRSSRQRWGSENRIIRAPPTGNMTSASGGVDDG